MPVLSMLLMCVRVKTHLCEVSDALPDAHVSAAEDVVGVIEQDPAHTVPRHAELLRQPTYTHQHGHIKQSSGKCTSMAA
jgi:hypothetical protein